ncbi:PKD domain-containing protein (fragment) [Nitrospira lenta]|uniref:PKD domain-containing protein n=1 Tax=Nitrospira lenta TaxID=1436998 RepID=A0A330L9L8_9BACT
MSSTPDTVNITSDNVAPVSNAGPDQLGKQPASVIALDGLGSSDANGDPLTYSWSLTKPVGSAATLVNPTTASPTFTVDREGNYVAQLIVNDGTVNSSPDSVIVTVTNVAPIANAGPDQSGQTVAALIHLSGSASTDGNGDLLTYSWTLITRPPGSVATLANPTTVSPAFTADLSGSYTVELVVSDGQVSSSPDTVTIIVN